MKQWQRNKPDLFTKNARNHQGHDRLTVRLTGIVRRCTNTFPLKSLHYSKRRKNVLFIPLTNL